MCIIEKKTAQAVMAQKVTKVEKWHQFLKVHGGTLEGLPFELSHEWHEEPIMQRSEERKSLAEKTTNKSFVD